MIGSVYGLAPFDLLAPSRLIYPVYTLFRNKFARPAGQGTSRIERVFTGISGSQTGGQGVLDISISEMVGTSNTFSSWPLNLPSSGAQTETQLNVPYRFFGITEQLSWLAQFAGQGFEDISALANLILLQEMFLGEEYQMICGTSQAIAAPTVVSVTARTALSGETAIGSNSDYAVGVSAVNYFGETVASSFTAVSGGTGATQVVDVVIGPSAGALTYNIWVSTNASPSSTNEYLAVGQSQGQAGSQTATAPGGVKFTLQGTAPSAGVHPLSADSGTGKLTRMEGVIPTLTGASATAGIYPKGWLGGYVNQSVGTHLSYNCLYTAFDSLWESQVLSPGAFKADPDEIVGDGGDLMRLSQDIISQGAATNYRLFLDQGDTTGMRVGGAVSEFVNPVTKKLVRTVVHPWYAQGTATLMQYEVPSPQTSSANAWEMTMVQDVMSIAWPVIDATFRYSIFEYGALVCHAPQYSGVLGGLQVTDSAPYT